MDSKNHVQTAKCEIRQPGKYQLVRWINKRNEPSCQQGGQAKQDCSIEQGPVFAAFAQEQKKPRQAIFNSGVAQEKPQFQQGCAGQDDLDSIVLDDQHDAGGDHKPHFRKAFDPAKQEGRQEYVQGNGKINNVGVRNHFNPSWLLFPDFYKDVNKAVYLN